MPSPFIRPSSGQQHSPLLLAAVVLLVVLVAGACAAVRGGTGTDATVGIDADRSAEPVAVISGHEPSTASIELLTATAMLHATTSFGDHSLTLDVLGSFATTDLAADLDGADLDGAGLVAADLDGAAEAGPGHRFIVVELRVTSTEETGVAPVKLTEAPFRVLADGEWYGPRNPILIEVAGAASADFTLVFEVPAHVARFELNVGSHQGLLGFEGLTPGYAIEFAPTG